MNDFPQFMKNSVNAIHEKDQSHGIEGYAFDGADGSQMIFWTCSVAGKSAEHVHDYDEYFVVLQGCYTLIINGERIEVKQGEEYHLPRHTPHAGEFTAGMRSIHAFGGKRAGRVTDLNQITR